MKVGTALNLCQEATHTDIQANAALQNLNV